MANQLDDLLINPIAPTEAQPASQPQPLVSNDSLLKITPVELNSQFASEQDKIIYKQARTEFGSGLLGAPDYVDNTGAIVPINAPNPDRNDTPLTDTYTSMRQSDISSEVLGGAGSSADPVSDDETEEMFKAGGMSGEEIAYWAEKNAPERARQKKIMEAYAAYKDGQMSYESFLLKTYGNDYLKAQGHNTDSVAYWKSQFREGNFQHPLDNEFLRAAAIQQAESLFQLESFFQSMVNPEARNLSNLVGHKLDEEDYKKVFGKDWDETVKQLGSYERAVRYFKGGYLGDQIQQLIYRSYNNDGTPVGDPSWYVGTDGKLYELVADTSKTIDKNSQMYLYKNPDGTIDRVSMFNSEFKEGINSFFGGFVGALTSFVDLFAIAGIGLTNLGNDKGFSDAFTDYNNAMNSWKSFGKIVQDFDNDKWDASNISRGVGSAFGYVLETSIEIALGVLTSGAYAAAMRGAKSAKAASTSVIKGSVKGFVTKVSSNIARIGGKKMISEAAEKAAKEGAEAGAKAIAKETLEALTKKAGKETVEELLESLGDDVLKGISKEMRSDVIKELFRLSGREFSESLTPQALEAGAKQFLKEAVTEMAGTGTLSGADVTVDKIRDTIIASMVNGIKEDVAVKTAGHAIGDTIKRGALWSGKQVFAFSNQMKMLNSGSVTFFLPTIEKIFKKFGIGKLGFQKWGATTSRAIISSALTFMEVDAHQRVRQQVDPELTNEQRALNNTMAMLVQFASTMLLASSVNDQDNIQRFQFDTDDDRTFLMRAMKELGESNYTSDNVRSLATKLGREYSDDVFKKYTTKEIGKYMRRQTLARVAGGVSEFIDNIWTASSRNAAISGVKTPLGVLFNTEGMFSPDVLMSSLLSTRMSVVGRKGIFGFGTNEGSMGRGAAAMVEDTKRMYMMTINYYKIMSEYATDDNTRMAAREIVNNMNRKFTNYTEANNGNTAYAMLDVMEDFANEASGGKLNPNNPLAPIDANIKKFAEYDGFKDAIKDGAFNKNNGLDKIITGVGSNRRLVKDFSLSDFVGISSQKDKYQKYFSYERALIAEVDLRLQRHNTITSESGNKFKDIAKKIIGYGKNFIVGDPYGTLQKKMNEDLRSGISSQYVGELFGGTYDVTSVKDTVKFYEQVGIRLTENEIVAQEQRLYNEMNNKLTYTKLTVETEFQIIQKARLDLRDAFKSEFKISDDGEAETTITNILNNKIAEQDKTDEYKKMEDFISKTNADINNKIQEEYGHLTITNEDIVAIAQHHTDKDGNLNKTSFDKALKNGSFISFMTPKQLKQMQASAADSPERRYYNFIRAGIKALRQFNLEAGSDFIVLGEDDGELPPRVFINNPREVNGIKEMYATEMRLRQAVLFGGMLGSQDDPSINQEMLIYAKALYGALKYNERQYENLNDLIAYSMNKENSPVQFAAFIDYLSDNGLISVRQTYNLITAMMLDPTDDFNIAVIKQLTLGSNNPNSITKKIFETSNHIKELKRINNSATGRIAPQDYLTFKNAVEFLQTNIYAPEGGDQRLKALIELFNLDPGKDGSFQRDVEALYRKYIEDPSFYPGLTEMETLSKHLSISSSLSANYKKHEKSTRDLIKKMRSFGEIYELETVEQFNERLKRAQDKRESNFKLVEQIRQEIKRVLSDPAALNEIRQDPELRKQFVEALEPFMLNKKSKHGIDIKAFLDYQDEELNLKVESTLKEMLDKNFYESVTDDKNYLKDYLKKELKGFYYSNFLNNAEFKKRYDNILNGDSENKIKDINELITEAYKEAEIYSNTEADLINAIQIRDEIYNPNFSSPNTPNKGYITVDLGEVYPKAMAELERRVVALGIAKDGRPDMDKVNDLIRGEGNAALALRHLISIRMRNQNSPIIRFDMSNHTEQLEFNRLFQFLGYDDDDLLEAQSGTVFKIPGVYFNGDTRAIKVGSGKQGSKYNNLNQLLKSEQSALRAIYITQTMSHAITERENIIRMFPVGIIDFNLDTPIKRGELEVQLGFSQNDALEYTITKLVKEITQAHKSGKAASNSAGTYSILLPLPIMKGQDNPELQNYLLVRSVIDKAKSINEDTMNNELFLIPEDILKDSAHIAELESFGWILSDDKSLIKGIDTNKNAKYLKEHSSLNISRCLPVSYDADLKKFRLFNMRLDAQGSTKTFARAFDDELFSINSIIENTEGILKIINDVDESPVSIPSTIKTYGDAIGYLEKEYPDNLVAKSLIFSIKSMVKASAEYESFMKFYYPEEKQRKRIMQIGRLVHFDKVAEIIANSDSDEDAAKKIMALIKKNKDSTIFTDVGTEETHVKGSSRIPNARYIATIDTRPDYDSIYNNLKGNSLTADDIALLKDYANKSFIDDAPTEAFRYDSDIKNKFLSLLSENEKGEIILPIANLRYISQEDLDKEITNYYGEKLKLGTWIKNTMGEEFYGNMIKVMDNYGKLLGRSKKLKPTTFTLAHINKQNSPSNDIRSFIGRDATVASEHQKMIAENRINNMDLLAKRRAAMEDDVAANSFDDSNPALSPLYNGVKNLLSDPNISEQSVNGATRVANIKNSLIKANIMDNLVGTKDILMSGKMKAENEIGGEESVLKITNEEEAANIAKKIFTLSTLAAGEQKLSFLIFDSVDADDQGNKSVKVTEVFADKDDPLIGLTKYMAGASEEEGHTYFVLRINPSFQLLKPEESNKVFHLTNITGFKSKPTTSGISKYFGRRLFVKLLAEHTMTAEYKDGLSSDEIEYSKQVQTELHKSNRLAEERLNAAEYIFNKLSETEGVINDNFTKEQLRSLLSAIYKTTMQEIKSTIENPSIYDEGEIQTIQPNASILQRHKKISAKNIRLQALLYDYIDPYNQPAEMKKALSMISNEILDELKKDKNAFMESDKIVSQLLNGETNKIPKLMNLPETMISDAEIIKQVMIKYALRSGDSGFQKFIFQSMLGEQTLSSLKAERASLKKALPLSTTLKGANDINAILNNDDVVKIYFDSEYITQNKKNYDDENPGRVYEIAFMIDKKDGSQSRKTFNIAFDDDEDIYAAVLSDVDARYSSARSFLIKNELYQKFKSYGGDSRNKDYYTKAAAFAQIEDYIKQQVGDKNFVLISFNGKGKNSDIDSLKSTFAKELSTTDSLFGKVISSESFEYNDKGSTYIGHLDFYNDIAKNMVSDFTDANSPQNNKLKLESIARKLLGKDLKESHKADEDINLLYEVMKKAMSSHSSRAIAQTKVLDYVQEIYKVLTGKKINIDEPDKIFDDIDKYLRFDGTKIFTEDPKIKSYLETWNKASRNIPEILQKTVIDSIDYFEVRKQTIAQNRESEQSIRYSVGEDYFDNVKAFLKDNSSKEIIDIVKTSFNKIYGIFSTISKLDASYEDNQKFMNTLINSLKHFYGDTLEQINSKNKNFKLFSHNSLMAFVEDLKTNKDETTIKLIKDMLYRGSDHNIQTTINEFIKKHNINIDEYIEKFETSSQHNIWETLVESDPSDNPLLLNLHKNRIANASYRKLMSLFNGAIFDELKGSEYKDLRNYIGNQLLTLFGADINMDDATVKAKQAAQTINVGTNDYLIKAVRDLTKKGFKDALYIPGFYRYARGLTDQKLKELKNKELIGKEETGANIILVNKSFAAQILSQDPDEYKKTHNLNDIYVSIKRDPADRTDPLHAYKMIIEDDNPNDTGSYIAMRSLNMVSKHNGDFDGDKLTIYIPTDTMQMAYNKTPFLSYINKPYDDVENFLSNINKKYPFISDREDFVKNRDLQAVIANILHINESIGKQFIDLIKGDVDEKRYSSFSEYVNSNIKKAIKEYIKGIQSKGEDSVRNFIGLGRLSQDDLDTYLTTERILNNLVKFDDIENKYLINNPFLTKKTEGKYSFSDSFNEIIKNNIYGQQIDTIKNKVSFEQSRTMIDSMTGMIAKDILHTIESPKNTQFITMKLDDSQFAAIKYYINNETIEIKKMNPELDDVSINKKINDSIIEELKTAGFIQGNEERIRGLFKIEDGERVIRAGDIYSLIVANQYFNRNAQDYKDLEAQMASIVLKNGDGSALEDQINFLTSANNIFENLLNNRNMNNNRFVSSNPISLKDTIAILDYIENTDTSVRSRETAAFLKPEEMKEKGLTKKVTVLVDNDNVFGLEQSTAKATKNFAETTEIYFNKVYDPNEKIQKISGAEKSGKLQKIGNRYFQIYKAKILQGKLGVLGQGTFGKVTFNKDYIADDKFGKYDFVISKDTADKGFEKNNNISFENNPVSVTINGKNFTKLTYEVYVAENPAAWNQDDKEMKFDQLGVIHSIGTAEALPLFGASLASVNKEGQVIWNAKKLIDIGIAQKATQDKDFHEVNMMSVYTQLRAIKLINFGLKNIKDQAVLDKINEYKKEFFSVNKDFSSAQANAAVLDLFRLIETKLPQGERFSDSIIKNKNSLDARLFSKDLFNKALINTMEMYNYDVDVATIMKRYNDDPTLWGSKAGVKDLANSLYERDVVETLLRGNLLEQSAKQHNSELVDFYLPSMEFINYLLPDNESISKSDAQELLSFGFSNLGKLLPTGLENYYNTVNYLGSTNNERYDAALNDMGLKTGIGGEAPHTEILPTSNFGVTNVGRTIENPNDLWHDIDLKSKENAFDRLKSAWRIDDDERMTDKPLSETQVGLLLFKLKALNNIQDDQLDRILMFAGKTPKSVQGFFNPAYIDMSDGVLKRKYYTNTGLYSSTGFKGYKETRDDLLPGNFSYDFFKARRDYIAEQANNLEGMTKADIGEVQSAKATIESERYQIPKGFSEVQAMKTLLDVVEDLKDNRMLIVTSEDSNNDYYVSKDAIDVLQYFKPITKGYNSDFVFRYSALDPEGMDAKNKSEMEAKEGIGVYHTKAKTYQMDMLRGLSSIKSIIGDDANALDKFGQFTKARGLFIMYNSAVSLKDEIAIKRANEQMARHGFQNIDGVKTYMKEYQEFNPGLVKIYQVIINDILEAAKDSANIIGIKNNPEELMLYTTLRPASNHNEESKAKYYSSLNTMFLNKKQKLEDVLIQYADFNFAESVWYLSANLSKIKAIGYAQKFYLKSGATDNKAIFDIANDDFHIRLENLSNPKSTRLYGDEKMQIINSLRKKGITLSDQLATSDKFLSEVYGEISKQINAADVADELKTMSIFELEQIKLDPLGKLNQDRLDDFITLKKIQRDFMTDCVLLNKELADSIYGNVKAVAAANGAVLTNEFLQKVPESDKEHFNFLAGYDFNTLRRNIDFSLYGETYAQRIAYMALTGNLFMTNEGLTNHLNKYFYTEKIPNRVEKIFGQARGSFTKFVMSMPHKLINRLTQYSFGDLALISATSPSSTFNSAKALRVINAFYESKGATLDRDPKLRIFLDSIGYNPFSYQNKSLNLNTYEYDVEPSKVGQAYFDFVDKAFSAQTLAGRYALWEDLYDRFKAYDDNPNGRDRRLYGPLYSQKELIDNMESPEAKATEIVGATIGGPNKFALIARKELNNWGIFLTYPLALMRTGVGHLKSTGDALKQVIEGTANNATLRYLGATATSVIGTQFVISALAGLIADLYDVDEETEEEWRKRGTYIDPFLTLLNDRPIPISMGTTGLYAQFREMFYEPFEKADFNILEGGWNWFTANIIARLNPIIKTPLELLTGKEFYGNAGPQDTTSRNFIDHLANKIMSMFIGASGAVAATDQWYYSKLGETEPAFVNRLAASCMAAIEGEMGHFRGYKTQQKNYFKALQILRSYKILQNGEFGFTNYSDNGFNLEQMSALSRAIKNAMDKEQTPSVIYGIIDEYIKDGASSSTIKAAIFNNSISGKISQIENFDQVYRSMSDKERVILDDALKYESANYSILKTIVQDYVNSKKDYTYKQKLYVPKNYYTYPQYSSSKYKSYEKYNNSWFDNDYYKKYAKDYMEYRAKQNFVPSLTKFTGKYAKDFYDYGEPRIKRVYGKINANRVYLSDDNKNNSSRVSKKGR